MTNTNTPRDTTTKFALGQVVATQGAQSVLEQPEMFEMIRRHNALEQGDLCASDYEANLEAVKNGSRIFSSFCHADEKVWVITEADRSVTTVLIPEEY